MPGTSNMTELSCTWCRRVASLASSPHARKCLGCLPTLLYCVDRCATSGCSAAICNEHPTCWQSHLAAHPPHMRDDHRVVDPYAALFVDAVTHSEGNEQKLAQLHKRDKEARWFYVSKENDKPELLIHDRFMKLCDPKRSFGKAVENDFPTIVSFIGNTSVGKSTIVRAMLLLGFLNALSDDTSINLADPRAIQLIRATKEGSGNAMPVPRSGHKLHRTNPTTLGVHLYHDGGPHREPRDGRPTADSQQQIGDTGSFRYPLLLADCEGFGAGSATTTAEQLADVVESKEIRVDKRDITADCYGNTNDIKDGIDLFYARVLYAVSDVIVFVTKSDATVEKDLKRMLELASAAVDKSYNQPSRKTLIIVRNMEEWTSLGQTESQEDEAPSLESLYLRNFRGKRLWESSSILSEFVEKYNRTERDRIQDNDGLYKALFHDIRCCSISDKGNSDSSSARAADVFSNLTELRKQIEDAVQVERGLKARSFAMYNVPTMDYLVGQVFRHFCEQEGPLDFYRAARRDNPEPREVSQHVANFLRIALEYDDGTVDMIVDAVALMMLIYQRRESFDPTLPEVMFQNDLKPFWEKGVNMYLQQYERCGARLKSGAACAVRGRYKHKKHVYVLETGTRPSSIIAGEFKERRSWSDVDKAEWTKKIQRKFCELYDTVYLPGLTTTPGQADERIHKRQKVTHRSHKLVWKAIHSNKTCLSCLQAVPDHVLNCGHSYCSRCVQEIGTPSQSFECAFDLSECALCASHNSKHMHEIRLKPKCAGVRLLSLDGGGIRGIVELVVLQAIHESLGLDISISELFDLVVGTSTGGIIALALVMGERETLEDCIKFFEKTCERTFRNPRGLTETATKAWMIFGRYDSLYGSDPLRDAMSNFFGETNLFAPAMSRNVQCTTRVAVTTARDEGDVGCIVANYNRPGGDWTNFEREDEAQKDIKVYEAGLATSAAPFYLSPFVKGGATAGGTDFIDGAVWANCPARVALDEKEKLWSAAGVSTNVDMLVSLGTGLQEGPAPRLPRVIRYGFVNPILKMFERQLDAEKNWADFKADFKRASPPAGRGRLYRLNPEIAGSGGKHVELFHWREIKNLRAQVEGWTSREAAPRIARVSNMLLASLFFFEPDADQSSAEGAALLGTIRCRLRHGSETLEVLLTSRDVSFRYAAVSESQLPAVERLPDSRWEEIPAVSEPSSPGEMATSAVDDGHRKAAAKFRVRCILRPDPSNREAEYQVLAVHLKDQPGYLPISGFPATLAELHRRSRSRWLQ